MRRQTVRQRERGERQTDRQTDRDPIFTTPLRTHSLTHSLVASWKKAVRMDPLKEDHYRTYGEKFGSHQHALAAKTGGNWFFENSKIPTKAECKVDSWEHANPFEDSA